VLRCRCVVLQRLCFVDERVVFVSHLAENLCCNFRTLAPLCARKHQSLASRYSVSVIHVHKQSIVEELMICILPFGSSSSDFALEDANGILLIKDIIPLSIYYNQDESRIFH
jgi:hypothetical protein